MGELEKLAAKKKITKRLVEALLSKKASAWLRPPNPGNLVKAPKSSPSFGGPAALLNIYGAGAPMFTGKRQLARAQRPILDRYRGLRNKPKMAPTTTPSTPKPMSPAQ